MQAEGGGKQAEAGGPASRRRLILHVGQSKAGSTAIQNYLDDQREALKQKGWLFPQSLFLRRNPFDNTRTPGHFGLITGISNGDMGDFEAELDRSGCANVIISNEGLFSDHSDQLLSQIGAYFEGWQVELLAVLRSYPEWAASRYVEEVLTGYRLQGRIILNEFAAGFESLQLHDYAKRLSVISDLLGADRATAINYDDSLSGPGLVPTFLNRGGIALTNQELARGIRANIREKYWFLLEGKRRLNNATIGLSAPLRLELEAGLREFSKALAKELPEPVMAFSTEDYPLSAPLCKKLAVSNRKLSRDFAMGAELSAPKPRRGRTSQHKLRLQGVDEIVHRGLHDAAALASRDPDLVSDRHAQGKLLGVHGVPLLVDILRHGGVSLHLGQPASAVWAACFHDGVAVYIPSQTERRGQIDELIGMHLPSQLLVLDDLARWPYVLSEDSPQIIVATTDTSLDLVKPAVKMADSGLQLCLLGCDLEEAQTLAKTLALDVRDTQGQTHLLVRPA